MHTFARRRLHTYEYTFTYRDYGDWDGKDDPEPQVVPELAAPQERLSNGTFGTGSRETTNVLKRIRAAAKMEHCAALGKQRSKEAQMAAREAVREQKALELRTRRDSQAAERRVHAAAYNLRERP